MGKCLIVTGGSRGIGTATARLAARQGWDVCLSYVRDGEAAAVVGDIEAAGGRAVAVQGDVGRDDSIAPLFDAAEAVVWLLSDAASYVAGAVLPVAGGR